MNLNHDDILASLRPHAERDLRACLNALVDEGDVIDVGACIGEYTQLLSSILTERKMPDRVFAIEPGEKTSAQLRENTKGLSNVTVIRAALGNRNETLQLSHHENWTLLEASDLERLSPARKGAIYVGPYLDLREANPIKIECLTLDRLCSVHDITPSFIKVDVDGWELRVLEGATSILDDYRPLMICELGPAQLAKLGESPEQVLNIIEEFDYEMYVFDRTLKPVHAFADVTQYVPAGTLNTVDLLCLPL